MMTTYPFTTIFEKGNAGKRHTSKHVFVGHFSRPTKVRSLLNVGKRKQEIFARVIWSPIFRILVKRMHVKRATYPSVLHSYVFELDENRNSYSRFEKFM